MKITKLTAASVAALVVIGLAAPGSARAEEPELGWKDVAELSLVVTNGNSETETLGFKNTLVHRWENALFTFNAGAVRSDSDVVRGAEADGTNPANPGNNIRITEEETTAEQYFANGRYDRDITERFFWNAGAGWDRNRPAGIENRYIAAAGVGNTWVEGDRAVYMTAYAVTYTDQEDVIEEEDKDDSFMGFRFTSDYRLKIGDRTKYLNLLVFDTNQDESDDLRADWLNSVAVSINSRFALKVSLQILWDNLPSLEELDEVMRDPATGDLVATGNTLFVELDRVDSIFTTSLVVNF